jgi:hypothetical protein
MYQGLLLWHCSRSDEDTFRRDCEPRRRSGLPSAAGTLRKRKLLGRASCLLAPRFEQPAVAQRQQVVRCQSQCAALPVDPGFRAFQLRERADRRLIDHAVATLLGKFRPPLLVHKRAHKAKPLKDRRQRLAILDVRFGLLAMLQPLRRIEVRWQLLVRQHPAFAVPPDAQDRARSAQAMFRCVE